MVPTRRTQALATALSIAASVAAAAPAGAQGAPPQGAPVARHGSYADVNGIRLYYEIHGSGRPLVLLHGGAGAVEIFDPILPALSSGRQVIAVDLQGHGRTADIDRPLDVRLMADDIAALVRHLGLERADVMGYSLGGGVAMQVAVRHPALVDRLVLVSAALRSDAYYPELRAQQVQVGAAMAEAMKDTPMYQLYSQVAPRPEDWPRLLDKLGEAMRQPYDFTEQVSAIRAPTLVVAGDADMFPPSHAVETFQLLGGGQRDGGWDGSGRTQHRLAILPGLTHYEIFANPMLAAVVVGFLEER